MPKPILPDDFAFPTYGVPETIPGMTCRQWLAGMALVGFCSQFGAEEASGLAVQAADALIERLNKQS